MIDEKLKF